MYPKKERVRSLLETAIKEMELLKEMSKEICNPGDFVSSTSGLIVFRACGMRNFLSHEYEEVDAEGIFNTVKTNIPELLRVSRDILKDLLNGKLDSSLAD